MMTQFEILSETQSEIIAGGWGSDTTFTNVSTEVSNVSLQSNSASTWASNLGGGGFGHHKMPSGGGASAGSIYQGNINTFGAFVLPITFVK